MSAPDAPRLPRIPLRLVGIALGWGLVAGVAAALALQLILGMQHVVWEMLPIAEHRWYVPLAVLTGGVLIALLRRHAEDADLDQEIALAADPVGLHRRRVLVLTASAMVAVGFGGPIGPEAGLVGVVAELSALVSRRLARSAQEARLIGTSGTAAVLAGLYGSPPAGAAYEDDTLSPGRLPTLLAATSGFLGFLGVTRLLGSEGMRVDLPAAGPGGAPDLLGAALAALLGGAVAVGYRHLRPRIASAVALLGSTTRQTLIGSALLALLLWAWPLLRFSGHHEMTDVLELATQGAWVALLALAALKALALALALAAGWRGGEFFPIVLAGAAAGSLALAAVPAAGATPVMVAGLAAAAAIALGKPFAVLLVCLLLFPSADPGPLLIGAGTGMLLHRVVPMPATGHGAADPDAGGDAAGR